MPEVFAVQHRPQLSGRLDGHLQQPADQCVRSYNDC